MIKIVRYDYFTVITIATVTMRSCCQLAVSGGKVALGYIFVLVDDCLII